MYFTDVITVFRLTLSLLAFASSNVGWKWKIIPFYCSRALCPSSDPSVPSDPGCQSPQPPTGSRPHLPSGSWWDVQIYLEGRVSLLSEGNVVVQLRLIRSFISCWIVRNYWCVSSTFSNTWFGFFSYIRQWHIYVQWLLIIQNILIIIIIIIIQLNSHTTAIIILIMIATIRKTDIYFDIC